MNSELISEWNKNTADDDIVWCLGDFAYKAGKFNDIKDVFDQLKGEKHLIIGNHDNPQWMKQLGWKSINHKMILREEFEGDKHQFVLHHYPLREWEGFWHGAFHAFGHTHRNLGKYCRSMDVGVDSVGYAPVTLESFYHTLKNEVNKHGIR